jgi:outer membrane protein assembly factor BamB
LLVSVSLSGADWPQWRGPQRNGVSSETGLLKEWPKAGPKVLWQAEDIGDGYSTPSIVGNRIFMTSNAGLDNEYVQALSVADGKRIWQRQLGKVGNPEQSPSFPAARSTPTVDGNVLYALSSDGDLACLDTATGKIWWQKNLRRDFKGQPGKWAYAESPLVDGDMLVVTPGGPAATLLALNKKTTEVIWKSGVPGGDDAGYASVMIAEAAGRKQYVQFLAKGVVGVDAKTGQFLWRYDATGRGVVNIATPVVNAGYVFSTANTGVGGLVKLTAAGQGVAAQEVYLTRHLPNNIGGSIVVGSTHYGTSDDELIAADWVTGKVLWHQGNMGAGSILAADGRLYIHTEEGEVVLAEASAAAYREFGRFTLPNQPKRTRGSRDKYWSYPVVANGRLYIREVGSLWCYDVSAR